MFISINYGGGHFKIGYAKLNVGDKIGRWTIIKQDESIIQPSGQKKKRYLCKCECGNVKSVTAHSLKKGISKSCGCLSREMTSIRRKTENAYRIENQYVIGITTNTNEEFIFDLEDYDKVRMFTWVSYNGYITTNNFILCNYPKTMKLHRLVMNETDSGTLIDHINHDKLDNRKSNLRGVTYSQNAMNHVIGKNNNTGVSGVQYLKPQNKWMARIRANYRNISLGNYDSKEDAILARKEAEEKYFGEYSYDNSMNGGIQN